MFGGALGGEGHDVLEANEAVHDEQRDESAVDHGTERTGGEGHDGEGEHACCYDPMFPSDQLHANQMIFDSAHLSNDQW